MTDFSHFDANGQAHMVDVSDKAISKRRAIAVGKIYMSKQAFDGVAAGTHKKGDVLGIARIAAIMASKKTPDLIPLCHPIGLTKVQVEFSLNDAEHSVQCEVTTQTNERTGVEMEALCAVNIALLTIYDMCKAVDKAMNISDVKLLYKAGGKSGVYQQED